MTVVRSAIWRLRTRFLRWARTPEPTRIDRERMYVWIHVGLVLVGAGIWARPESSGILDNLPSQWVRSLAVCMLVGSVFCLVASLMGWRWWVPMARVDVRLPYLVGMGGQLSVIGSLAFWVYRIQVTDDLIGTLSGGLAIVILCACVQFCVVAIKEIAFVARYGVRLHAYEGRS